MDQPGYCESHTDACKQQSRAIERWRGSAASRGYDYAWQKVRKQALERDNHLCVECLKHDRITPATDVDHIVPFEGLDDPLRLDLDNLQSLCRSCHNIKTPAQQRRG